MITEKFYTDKNNHPEDKIYNVKKFINELSNVQDYYFNQLVLDLNLNDKGSDWLFDYVFNSSGEYDGFDHYLLEHGVDYTDLLCGE
jgi:hypothetical protein